MKSNFADNIKELRKEQHVTQEQLAEAMGVSAGAIYKWEQAISTPDIEVIMEIASFFGVSVDALIGYRMYSSNRDRILQELKCIKQDKSYEHCWDEVEKWIRRYPNDFEIVYHSGVLYHLASIETGNQMHIIRSIELLSHACILIDQNRDPELSEAEIHRDIAIAYLTLGEWDKGMELLKQNNPCGINDDLIGHELAANPHRRHEAIPYLTNVLIHCTAGLYRAVIGFINVFSEQKDYLSAIGMLTWMIRYLDGLRTADGVSYLDKDQALLLVLCGESYEKIGEVENAKKCLRQARQIAKEFDQCPNYSSQNIKYCGSAEPKVAYDNIGHTAMDTVFGILQQGEDGEAEPILKLWEEICNEK